MGISEEMNAIVNKRRRLRIIGLMSGTSMDGVDAAMIETDGYNIFDSGPVEAIPYEPSFRKRLRSIIGRSPDTSMETVNIIRDLTLHHAEVVRTMIKRLKIKASEVDLIGFHGQTVFHAPKEGITSQIGDAELLAKETGIDVVADFRSADVAAGGEGAPLASIYHVALCKKLERPVAVLNLGGIGNVSWINAEDQFLSFDTGPANALIDDWVIGRTGQPWDHAGRLARSGNVQKRILDCWLANTYFDRQVPKSLDRNEFANSLESLKGYSTEDGAATLTAFTIEAIMLACTHFPLPPLRWLVAGGGRHNEVVMEGLRANLGVPVEPVEVEGWDGDALEAQAFGFLAARVAFAMPITYPQTTGVDRPMSGGKIFNVP